MTVSGPGIPGTAARVAQKLYDGRRTAIDRMAGECADLGGHGIVGASLQVREIPADSVTAGGVEFTVIGTAVRARGCPPLARPFAATVSGQDFAKLVVVGWVPAGIALGISVAALHDDLLTTSSGPWGTGNAEVPAYTDLMIQARQDARSRLEQAVLGLGADGVVVSALTLGIRSDACRAHAGGTDHFAEAVLTGTASRNSPTGARRRPRHRALLSCRSTPVSQGCPGGWGARLSGRSRCPRRLKQTLLQTTRSVRLSGKPHMTMA